MIDYTQYAFANPVSVVDPIPSVADYLNDYRAQNEAWYGQWAYPMGQGQWGARPESFEVRAPWTADLLPEEVLPPILQTDLATGEAYGGEAFGAGSTGQEDRPVGALVRDPAEMSNEELWSEYMAYTDPMAKYAGSVPGAVVSTLATAPTSLLGGLMARQGMADRSEAVLNEVGRRMGALYAPQAQASQIFDGGGISRAAVPVQGGTYVFTGGDVLPTGTVGPSGGEGSGGGPAGPGQDTHQGGEVGAGGWAGEGGL